MLADPFAIGLSLTGDKASNISGALSELPFMELTDHDADLLCSPLRLPALALASSPLAKMSRLTESLLREMVPSRLIFAPGAFLAKPYRPALG